MTLKARAQADEDWTVRGTAMQELARGWKDDPETLPILKARAQADDYPAVRRSAVRELARSWKTTPRPCRFSKPAAQSDEDPAIRRSAVQELARGWKRRPRDLDDSQSPCAIRRGLGRAPECGAGAGPRLERRPRDLADSQSPNAIRRTLRRRQTAMEELVRGWKDSPDTLPILKARANPTRASPCAGRGAGVGPRLERRPRDLAVAQSPARSRRGLARASVRSAGVGPRLERRPRYLADSQSPRNSTRCRTCANSAMQELVRGWKDDSETLLILKALAQADEDWPVRQCAVQELVRGWKDDPETLPILKDRASRSALGGAPEPVQKLVARLERRPRHLAHSQSPRASRPALARCRTAMQELARGWKDDPETLHILRAAASRPALGGALDCGAGTRPRLERRPRDLADS